VRSFLHVTGVVDQAILAVRGVRIERHVTDHAKLRQGRLERLHRPRDQAVRVPGLGGVGGLADRVDDRKQRQRRNPQIGRRARVLDQQVDAAPLDARHGRDRLAPPAAVQHEHRVDEIGRRQARLAHQFAQKAMPAQAAQAGRGVIAFAHADQARLSTMARSAAKMASTGCSPGTLCSRPRAR